jgi:hypothetical protein
LLDARLGNWILICIPGNTLPAVVYDVRYLTPSSATRIPANSMGTAAA